jgi:MerR family transcriptional regulator, copper efflux regulator
VLEKGQRIGDAAATLGVATHVLRHWEDVGLLRPRRLSSGHRAYDDQTIGQARMIQICQQAGLSLAEIKELARRDRGKRISLIESKRAEIAKQVSSLRLADRFLAHVAHCEHPVISECPECSALSNPARPVRRHAAR